MLQVTKDPGPTPTPLPTAVKEVLAADQLCPPSTFVFEVGLFCRSVYHGSRSVDQVGLKRES